MAGVKPEEAIRLAAEVTAELELLGQEASEIASLHLSTEQSAPRAIALLLHNYYTGAESMFVRITKIFGGTAQNTGKWHRQLLEDVALALPSLRPAIIGADTQELLGRLLGFRHVVRSLYSWRLDKARVDELAAIVPAAHAALAADLAAFNDFLAQLADASRVDPG